MKVFFILHNDFLGPSGMHVFHLANELANLGCPCVVAINGPAESVKHLGKPRFRIESYQNGKIGRWHGRPGPGDIIHAWTPREQVRKVVAQLQTRFPAPCVIHLEDNEEQILVDFYKQPYHVLENWDDSDFLYAFRDTLIIPKHYRSFLEESKAVTCIYDSLEEFSPPGKPTLTFWASCEPEIFDLPAEPNQSMRETLGIDKNEIALVYPGNIHNSNLDDMKTYYEAVKILNSGQTPVKLIRMGLANSYDKQPHPGVIHLGAMAAQYIPHILSAADILVQPGSINEFNKYRFPCKLPMFLASARPVVLPKTNIGHHLTHGENCLLLQQGSTEELVGCISVLAKNKELRKKLGSGGRKFAEQHFSWKKNAEKVLRLYKQVLAEQ